MNLENFFCSIIIVKFGRTNCKRNFFCCKKLMKILDVNVNNIVISKLVKTKTNFKYLIGYLNQDIRPLVLIMAKISGNIKD